ncbi:hypothetical protein Vretifemale_7169, partial [Volvox reticuliferus]
VENDTSGIATQTPTQNAQMSAEIANRELMQKQIDELTRKLAEVQSRLPPEPQFNVNDDPEMFISDCEIFTRWYKTPAFLLLQTGTDAKQWLHDLKEQDPTAIDKNMKELSTLFLKRFAPKVESRKLEAQKSLVDGKIVMDPKKGVPEYAARFRAVVQRARLTDVSLTLLSFRRGLTSALPGPCRVNHEGEEFPDLDKLITHAIGEEKGLQEKNPNRISLNYAHADRTPRPKRTRPQLAESANLMKAGRPSQLRSRAQRPRRQRQR